MRNKLINITMLLFMGFGLPTMLWAESKAWFETIKMNGDFRYRFENIQEETVADRDRQSIRARIGLEANPAENWITKLRLATGGISPTSSEQTLGEYFTRKPIGLDLASMEYSGFPFKASLVAGKMENPFFVVGKSQLIWDGDLTPEGIAGNVEHELLNNVNAFLHGSGFWVQEKAANLDPMIYGAQTGMVLKTSDMQLTAGFGYFYNMHITGQYVYDYAASNTATAKSYGNSLNNGKYAHNYMLGEGFVEVVFKVHEMPIKVYLDYVLNNGAVAANCGYLAGLNFNQAKEPGSWEIGYNFRRLEKDAVVGAFCDSSFIGGGTNGSGHNLFAAYAIANKAKICVNYLICRKDLDNPKEYRRLQLDAMVAY